MDKGQGAPTAPQNFSQLRTRIALKYGQGRGILLSREDLALLYRNLAVSEPSPASLADSPSSTAPQFCFECDDKDKCASAEVCYAMHEGFPKLRADFPSGTAAETKDIPPEDIEGIVAGLEDLAAGRVKPIEQMRAELAASGPSLREKEPESMDLRGALAAAKIALHMFTNTPAEADSQRRMVFRLDPNDYLQIRQLEEAVDQALAASAPPKTEASK
jgi:hypothetical protein